MQIGTKIKTFIISAIQWEIPTQASAGHRSLCHWRRRLLADATLFSQTIGRCLVQGSWFGYSFVDIWVPFCCWFGAGQLIWVQFLKQKILMRPEYITETLLRTVASSPLCWLLTTNHGACRKHIGLIIGYIRFTGHMEHIGPSMATQVAVRVLRACTHIASAGSLLPHRQKATSAIQPKKGQ